MTFSSDSYSNTGMLHEDLSRLVGFNAVEVASGRRLGAGLLNLRTSECGEPHRPRLVVIAGLAGLVGRILKETVRQDMLIASTTKDNGLGAPIGRVYGCCPETARDLTRRIGLPLEEIVRLSHSARIAEPEILSPEQAALFYREIQAKLNKL